jgi:hypothetical protein
MFASQIHAAIGAANGIACLDELAKALARASLSGAIREDEYQTLGETLDAKRLILKALASVSVSERRVLLQGRGGNEPFPRRGQPGGAPSYFPPKRRAIRPDREESWHRKNRLGLSSPLPFHLERGFTVGQLAVLRIIADEFHAHGQCDRSLAEIAARAGVSESWAKQAIRVAKMEGLLSIEHRPQWRDKHKPNVITIVSDEWRVWIKRAPRRKVNWAHRVTREEYLARKKAAQMLRVGGASASLFQEGGGSFVTATENPTGYLNRTTANLRAKTAPAGPLNVATRDVLARRGRN